MDELYRTVPRPGAPHYARKEPLVENQEEPREAAESSERRNKAPKQLEVNGHKEEQLRRRRVRGRKPARRRA